MASSGPTLLDSRTPFAQSDVACFVQVQTNALMSAAEVAQGTRYTEALTTSWSPPKYYRDMTEEECDKLRDKWSILVDVSPARRSSECRRHLVVCAVAARKVCLAAWFLPLGRFPCPLVERWNLWGVLSFRNRPRRREEKRRVLLSVMKGPLFVALLLGDSVCKHL